MSTKIPNVSKNKAKAKAPTAIFVKGRAYDKLDLLQFFKRQGRVTLGYLAWKSDAIKAKINSGEAANEIEGKKCFYFPYEKKGAPDAKKCVLKFGNVDKNVNIQVQISQNAGLVRDVSEDTFVVIPRPREGKFWIGKIAGDFKLFNWTSSDFHDAEWQAIKQIQDKPGNERKDFDKWDLPAQVCQGWELKMHETTGDDKYLREVALFRVPSIVRKIMASRQSRGRIIIPSDYEATVRVCLEALWKGEEFKVPDDTLEKLRFLLTPTSFEHICVELLNLRDKSAHVDWLHVGGAGDGGVDGAGFCNNKLDAILQCKYEAKGKVTPKKIINELEKNFDEKWPCKRLILASLWDSDEWTGNDKNGPALRPKDQNVEVEVWNGAAIADLVKTHGKCIPSLRQVLRKLDT